MRVNRAACVFVCVVAALMAVVVLSVGGALASSRTAADQSYTDPAGDGGVGTDITNLTVRNDANGVISFQVQSASPVVVESRDRDLRRLRPQFGDGRWGRRLLVLLRAAGR